MADRPFELRVLANGDAQYGLVLFQKPHRGRDADGKSDAPKMVVKVNGTPLKAVLDQVLLAIKRAGYKPSELSRSREEPFDLPEDLGVRLGLLFLAVKPLRKTSRMADISEQIQGMTEEESYYWYSKVTDASRGVRSQKAFRILLATE
ncbi:MAG: hypothetical protein JOZ63_14920 [Planctomycetaceae bacterium]|nr:hypothetical protein [Planctomycetaceae bacterium]